MSPDKYIFTLLLSDFFLRQTYLLSLHPSVNSSNVFSVTVTKYDFATLSAIFFFLLFVKTQEEKKGALSGLKQPLAAVSPLKMMKNAFYFTSKALFVLKIFKFCLDFLVM